MKCALGRCKFLAAIAALFLIVAASLALYVNEQGNFHPITAGEAYRSAQMDNDELAYYIKKYKIRSILNLRGKNPDETWYKDELKVSARNNVTHYDLALSATNEPGPKDIRDLMNVFSNAPRPLLLHCKAGADRSGLAAAIWKVVVDKESKAEADKQLSIVYGHIPMGGTEAMDNFFRKWDPASVKISGCQISSLLK